MSIVIGFKYNNGDVLRDKVTGLQGVVMVRAEYATGCHHYGLSPRKVLDSGAVPDWQWLDQSRLELVESVSVRFDIPENSTSGPEPKGPQV